MITSSRSQVFFKTGALNNFTNFTKKPVLESYFKACSFIEKRRQHRCFPMKFANFLSTHFLQDTSGGCFLMNSSLVSNVNKKYNCSGPPAFKSQNVGYQSNQKLLHNYQH